jgi:formylglycine-generating enzyme required for sulfatase activity
MRATRCAAACLTAALLALGLAGADDRPPRKVAFLVGVATYDFAFENLQFPERDVAELAQALRDGGFEVVVLTGSARGKDRATRKIIEERLAALLDGGGDEAKTVRKGDVVLVALSGHGLQMEVADATAPGGKREDAFFCPVDALRNRPATLLGLTHLLDDVLAPRGCRSLLLVDACRDIFDPNKGSKGVEGRDMALKGETAVLFSCGRGEKSWESKEAGHGVFTHAVLRGLREGAARKGEVTWSALVADVQDEMASEEFRKLIPAGYTQTPIPTSGQMPRTVLIPRVRVERPALLDCTEAKGTLQPLVRAKQAQEAWAKYLGRAVEEEHEIAPGVKMQFVLVPPGKFVMGSPEGEKGRDTDEVQHEVTLTRPFYLGRYEVTQAQYDAVAGRNPRPFETADVPVGRVSWKEADAFAGALTKERRDGLVFRLPTEAEWEYSCRGGRPSSMPFGIGDGTSLSSDQANFDGNSPYGGAGKGKYLMERARVGSYPPNAFGLHDMHGNVWEWCADWYDVYPMGKVTDPSGPASAFGRVIRGGGWNRDGSDCRASSRYRHEPSTRLSTLGFRVAAVPSGAGK